MSLAATSTQLDCQTLIRTHYRSILSYRDWRTGAVQSPCDLATLDVEPLIRLAVALESEDLGQGCWSVLIDFVDGARTLHRARIVRRMLLRLLDVSLRSTSTGTLVAWSLLANEAHLRGSKSAAELDSDSYWHASMLLRAAVLLRDCKFYVW